MSVYLIDGDVHGYDSDVVLYHITGQIVVGHTNWLNSNNFQNMLKSGYVFWIPVGEEFSLFKDQFTDKLVTFCAEKWPVRTGKIFSESENSDVMFKQLYDLLTSKNLEVSDVK